MTGTGANAQVLRIVIPKPPMPIPPIIKAFMDTRNIFSPKKDTVLMAIHVIKTLLLKVNFKLSPKGTVSAAGPLFSG